MLNTIEVDGYAGNGQPVPKSSSDRISIVLSSGAAKELGETLIREAEHADNESIGSAISVGITLSRRSFVEVDVCGDTPGDLDESSLGDAFSEARAGL